MSLRYDVGAVVTAMATPFNDKLEIDFEAVEKLVEHLINNGSDAILVAGTTGESPTLTHEEEFELLAIVKAVAKGRVKVIMGAGSNSTDTAVKSTKKVASLGADAILSVVPYYNKPSQRGLIEHFGAIAKASDIPIMLYNIPGRTGINMQPDTIVKVAEQNKNIFAVKQSCSDLDLVSAITSKAPEGFVVFSGDDSLTLPMMSLGAYGVVSVASHIIGNDIKKMIMCFNKGENEKARKIHYKCFPIFNAIFTAPNPIPIKACLEKAGIMSDRVRLPLVRLMETEKNEILKVVEAFENSN